LQRTYPISDADNYGTLLDRAGTYCAETLLEAILQVSSGKDKRVQQGSIDSMGFYCSGRRAGDERLNWAQTSREVFGFVRALSDPGPGAITFFEDTPVVIDGAEFLAGVKPHGGFPGAIVGLDGTSFLVKTLDTYVRVTQWHGDFTPRIRVRFT
jgi:methionyl-tRNA formyltransferase